MVELSLVMKDVPIFIKQLRDFFYKVKTKGKDGGRVFTKYLIMYNLPIEDLIEMVREEMSEVKLFIKLQAVIVASEEIIGQFIKLYLEIDIKMMQ